MKQKIALILPVCAVILSGCVNRESADALLSKGCQAASATFLKEGYSLKNVNKSTFKTSSEFGNGFREITLSTTESDGWANVDREIKCVFAEEMGVMGLSYSADFYQINYDGQIFGKSGTELIGDAETLQKISAAAAAGLVDGK